MTEVEANRAILEAFKAGWDPLHGAASGDEVVWLREGEVNDSLAEYLRVSIVPMTRDDISIGGIMKMSRGSIAVQVFTAAGSGTLRILGLCDDVRAVLENKSFNAPGVAEPVITTASPSRGPQTDAVWQMRLVEVPFTYIDAP